MLMRSPFYCILTAAFLLVALPVTVKAQELTPQEKQAEQELYESINTQIDRMTEQLELTDYQIFYLDSILVHDYKAMRAELQSLQEKKVSNTDLYYDVQYKWQDQVYYSIQKLLDEDQWAKYLKSGAERDKKARDKKRAKAGK